MNPTIPIATPVLEELRGANGTIVKNSRVKTIYSTEEGGDGNWYFGVVSEIHPNNICTIIYDDGDKWFGDAKYVYLVNVTAPALPSDNTISPIITIPDNMINTTSVLDSSNNSLYVNCKDCNQLFLRDINDLGSSGYYRCKDCRKNQLGRCIVNSCTIS